MNKISLGPSISLYKNVNIDIYDILKEINDDLWKNEMVVNQNGNRELDLDNRNTKSLTIPIKQNKDMDKKINLLSSLISDKIIPIEKDYLIENDTNLKSHDDYKILKYEIGGKFNLHRDDGGGRFRRMSWVYYINDDYEGGELCFPTFNIDIKPDAGDLIFFPSSYAYPHYVKPVISGTRYSIASWMR
jgi:predicted 2-oxoglutarate/Fe(II)-dependent dioxygenase YbiX